VKELIHTVLELEDWHHNIDNLTCEFCPRFGNSGKPVCQIRSRSKVTHKLVANDFACQSCKEKFENDELSKCERCSRLLIKSNTDVFSGKNICDCIKYKEDTLEKDLPVLPGEERESTFYERQINGLREELNTAEVEIDTHLEALEISEDWHKRQKQELLGRIKELETEVERLKKQTPQELLDEISKLKERVKELEEQNNQFVAQIEVKEVKKQHFWQRLKK
jgi:DNA repair exonuclease SbcCD ATPase subunit